MDIWLRLYDCLTNSDFISDDSIYALGSPFDIYDMLITVVAQLFIFFIPMATKDKYFNDYN